MPKFTKREESQLRTIPKGKGSSKTLKILAKKMKRSYSSVYQKWYTLKPRVVKGNDSSGSMTKVSPAKMARVSNNVNAMEFKAVDFDPSHTRVNHAERLSMEKGLDAAISTQLSSPKRAIKFPARLKRAANEYLKKAYPNNVFSFHADKTDKKFVLLAKKA